LGVASGATVIRIWATPELHETLLAAFLDDYGYVVIEDACHELLAVQPGPGEYHLWTARPAVMGRDVTLFDGLQGGYPPR
jgi:hypothetical protein